MVKVKITNRLQSLREVFPDRRVDAFLVTSPVNIRYLTRYPSSDSWLLVFPKQAFYLTDARYIDEVRRDLRGARPRLCTSSLAGTAFEIIRRHKIKRLGIESRHLSLWAFRQMERQCPRGVTLIPFASLIEDLRCRKDAEEIDQIRECLRLNLKAFQYVKRLLRPGRTERDILQRLECYVKGKGAGFSFPPIIAAGPNSSFPHASVTDRKLRNNDPVLVDMGIEINGYKSDLTRMFFLGKIQGLVRRAFSEVLAAQRQAIQGMGPGLRACEIDALARNYLKKNKLGRYFTHSLGHAVGLDIHEAPRLSVKDHTPLAEGMVLTVEPGVYFPHQFGIRIEDMVLVTHNGVEPLSRSSSEPQIVT